MILGNFNIAIVIFNQLISHNVVYKFLIKVKKVHIHFQTNSFEHIKCV